MDTGILTGIMLLELLLLKSSSRLLSGRHMFLLFGLPGSYSDFH